MKYISGDSQDQEESAKREASSASQKHTKHTHSNALAVEEYNNFDNLKNSYSINSNFENKTRSFIDNLLVNKNTVIDILSKQCTNDEKQNLLKKILDEIDPTVRHLSEEPKGLKDNHASAGNIEQHTKSMGMGDESHDSLLCDDDAPNRHLKDKMTSHSFHKRPLSQNNVLRAKSSRSKRRKKTPVHNKEPKSLVSNGQGSNSKLTQDTYDGDYVRSKKLIDDSKFGSGKGVVKASVRPKSSRGNRSFDNAGNIKGLKAESSGKGKVGSMANVSKTSTNFGKKKNSYGGAGQFNADKLLAKYRQVRNTGHISNSFTSMEQPQNNLVASIREKNSRNIEKFGDKGIVNSIMEVKENNSQYLINSDNTKDNGITHNMSFDVNQKSRVLKPKKKKEEATKALLNFEEMKRKIMQDYVKKNGKEIGSKIAQPSHHRNSAGPAGNHFASAEDHLKRTDITNDGKVFYTKEDDLLFSSEEVAQLKKSSKKAPAKNHFSAIYEGSNNVNWNTHQPLSQKSINTNGAISLKERPNSNKKHTPTKKQRSACKLITFIFSSSKAKKSG